MDDLLVGWEIEFYPNSAHLSEAILTLKGHDTSPGALSEYGAETPSGRTVELHTTAWGCEVLSQGDCSGSKL